MGDGWQLVFASSTNHNVEHVEKKSRPQMLGHKLGGTYFCPVFTGPTLMVHV